MTNRITRRKSLRRSPAIGAFLLLAFLFSDVSVQPVRAYEFDHYAWTYYLALQVGFTKRQAFQIASGAYALDWWPVTSPMEASTWDGIFGANHAVLGVFGDRKPALASKWRDLHAFADEQLVNGCSWSWQVENPVHQCLATIMKPPLTPENTPNKYKFAGPPCTAEVAAKVEEARAKQKKSLMALAVQQGNPGALMHFIQDYYAHFEWDTYRGHPAAAHLPDHLSSSRAKALCATRDTARMRDRSTTNATVPRASGSPARTSGTS